MSTIDANPGTVSKITLKKQFPTMEAIELRDEFVTVVRYGFHPTPQQFLRDTGHAKHAIMLVDNPNGITIMLYLYKGGSSDRDAQQFHRKLSRHISGYETVNWDTRLFWAQLPDFQLQKELAELLLKP